jgi:hypothetical protein
LDVLGVGAESKKLRNGDSDSDPDRWAFKRGMPRHGTRISDRFVSINARNGDVAEEVAVFFGEILDFGAGVESPKK